MRRRIPPDHEYDATGQCIYCAHKDAARASLSQAACSPSGIEREVCNDIAARQAKGLVKYGVEVSDNPLELKSWLQHAYEEALDQAIYLKRAIREMENGQAH